MYEIFKKRQNGKIIKSWTCTSIIRCSCTCWSEAAYA